MSMEPQRLGKYELRQRLASGGQGEVWKGFDLQLRRYVAVKQLNANLRADPDFIARFEREARFIAALHHPNIVKIHDFQVFNTPGSEVPTAYMVMDYVEGPTLAEYIRATSRQGQFPSPADLIALFAPISLALDYAHQKGVVHRDIKPANIMLDKRIPNSRLLGEPVLMDFGIAKLQGGAADTTKVLGTPLYISPEQAQGLNGDQRSDLYSLGIILYEVATGITPFRSTSLLALLIQHYQDAPPPPATINPAISPALSDVILKSIAKDPSDRFASASAMTIALAEALNVPVPSALLQAVARPAFSNDPRSYNTLSQAVTSPPIPDEQLPTIISAHNNATLYPASLLDKQTLLVADPQTPIPVSVPQQTRRRRGKLLAFASLALLLVLVLGSVAFFALRNTGTPPPSVQQASVGQVVFLSSQHAPGTLDTLQMNLQTIQDVPQGKHYYAWLETHEDSTLAVSWPFNSQNGTLSPASYTHPQHQSLLAHFPYLFLITSESTRANVPSFVPKDRLYYANIPQTKSSVDTLTLVDHLNRLLTNDPRLEQLSMLYGLQYWLLHNSQALTQEAAAAQTAWQGKQITSLRQHLVNMLYYLDGASCAPGDLHTVPQGTPVTADAALKSAVSVSLLDCAQNTVLSGLVTASGAEAHGLAQAPGATRYQTMLAASIQTALTAIQSQFKLLQQETLQLALMTNDQLLQTATQTLLGQIVAHAHTAYSGQTTPAQAGVEQTGGDIGHLASFDVFACPQGSSDTICLS